MSSCKRNLCQFLSAKIVMCIWYTTFCRERIDWNCIHIGNRFGKRQKFGVVVRVLLWPESPTRGHHGSWTRMSLSLAANVLRLMRPCCGALKGLDVQFSSEKQSSTVAPRVPIYCIFAFLRLSVLHSQRENCPFTN